MCGRRARGSCLHPLRDFEARSPRLGGLLRGNLALVLNHVLARPQHRHGRQQVSEGIRAQLEALHRAHRNNCGLRRSICQQLALTKPLPGQQRVLVVGVRTARRCRRRCRCRCCRRRCRRPVARGVNARRALLDNAKLLQLAAPPRDRPARLVLDQAQLTKQAGAVGLLQSAQEGHAEEQAQPEVVLQERPQTAQLRLKVLPREGDEVRVSLGKDIGGTRLVLDEGALAEVVSLGENVVALPPADVGAQDLAFEDHVENAALGALADHLVTVIEAHARGGPRNALDLLCVQA
mmetsp:Transcript_5915/g.24883  ORF Transcript_5915/g.24883 Transcript_5915/m.24883 type:complete len:292 (-) Transcript_5915:414-1289(-)